MGRTSSIARFQAVWEANEHDILALILLKRNGHCNVINDSVVCHVHDPVSTCARCFRQDALQLRHFAPVRRLHAQDCVEGAPSQTEFAAQAQHLH